MTTFDEYIIQGEPDKRQRAENWQIAIGLQAVDGLQPSAYLIETAQKHIEGEITIDEVKKRIDSYYETEEGRKKADDRTDEADKVASNITDILAEDAFSFNPAQYALIHRRLFTGMIKHAGEYRGVNLSKREWVLDGDTVSYTPYYLIAKTLDYEFEQERGYSIKGKNRDAILKHLASFIAHIWQIHPFPEGNTRTTAVFTIKYLRKLGFRQVNNDAFKRHSWYFRNALVRANYNDEGHCISETTLFLEQFLDNLLYGAQHELKNRYCHIFWEDEQENTLVEQFTVQKSQFTVQISANRVQILQDRVQILRQAPYSLRKTRVQSITDTLIVIDADANVTHETIAQRVGVSLRTAKEYTNILQQCGILSRQGSDKTGTWVVKMGMDSR